MTRASITNASLRQRREGEIVSREKGPKGKASTTKNIHHHHRHHHYHIVKGEFPVLSTACFPPLYFVAARTSPEPRMLAKTWSFGTACLGPRPRQEVVLHSSNRWPTFSACGMSTTEVRVKMNAVFRRRRYERDDGWRIPFVFS